MKESFKGKKRRLLRNSEYYSLQEKFDKLYEQAKQGKNFKNLMELIVSKENILLAYRNIKRNKGSKTPGTDKKIIKDIEKMEQNEFIKKIQNKFNNYHPKSVRRVLIPKSNGKKRPLGIPCIEDRIIQQCIKQVMEPICEAKFHKHSYGFRPNRSAHDAIARSMRLMNRSKLHYAVDIDIKGFFDNVNHSKLIKQLWTLGIRDKNLLMVLKKILRSEIEGEGVQTQGTPQGGILSPLLSNVVLNELDWWISSQWETAKTKHQYAYGVKWRVLRNTNMKECWLVRYADDFKLFCRDYKSAQRYYNATRLWLKERLHLDISPEKSKITNLRKNHAEFLGLKFKVIQKSKKYICKSNMTKKSKEKTKQKIIKQIKILRNNITSKEVCKLNSIILGSHNYYKCATWVSVDFKEISYHLRRTIYNRLGKYMSTKPKYTETYKKLYGDYTGKCMSIKGVTIFPIHGCKTSPPMCFNQKINNYTVEGRKLIHDKLGGYQYLMEYLLRANVESDKTEYCDNKISLIAGQRGKCWVTKRRLEIGNMECHHKKPRKLGGTDAYRNLVWLLKEVHILIHSKESKIINKYKSKLNLDEESLRRVNSLRKLVGNSSI